MGIYWEIASHTTNRRFTKCRSAICLCSILILAICTSACTSSRSEYEHYFLDGYEHLEFRDSIGDRVPPEAFIESVHLNNARAYQVKDSSLTLYNTWQEEPYTGFIRTFHKGLYNLQGEFEDGKMFRFRYWYSDRTLGMDANYREQSGSVWNREGRLVVNWNKDEMYYLSAGTRSVRRIITDTLTSYFDSDGELTRYTVYKDTAIISYYKDGTPRFKFPVNRDGQREGTIKRWHPNGQLQAVGQYKNGQETGIWVEYDSMGNEIGRKVFE